MKNNLIFNGEYLEQIKALTLMDDNFMTICFDGFIEGAELVLRTILERSDLSVVSVNTQVRITSFENRSVWLDILAVDQNHKLYNIEIQQADSGANFKRARYHSSVLDSKYLIKGKNFSELPETYVIFITKNDVIGEDKPIYFVERIILNCDKLFDDEEHIIYVNGAHKDDKTDLGKLMHDFFSTDPNDMNFDVLADKVRYYKENEEGIRKMSNVFEEVKNKGREEGIEEGLIMAYLQDDISREAVMRLLKVSEDEFDELVSIYNK